MKTTGVVDLAGWQRRDVEIQQEYDCDFKRSHVEHLLTCQQLLT
jgi:hypothetical protein